MLLIFSKFWTCLEKKNYLLTWEGPFMVINSSSHGAITLQNDKGKLFKVNGQRLKLFLERNKELEEIDMIHFYLPIEN